MIYPYIHLVIQQLFICSRGILCARYWEYSSQQEKTNPVVGRIMDPHPYTHTDVHVLILGMSKYVMLHGRGELRLPIR